MIHGLYRAFSILGGPVIDVYLKRRMVRGKEDPGRAGERRGIASLPRSQGGLVWLHAASVGESLSLLPLARRLLQRPGTKVLVTTGTVTSARLMAERLPEGAVHQYVPVDRPAWVRRFLDHWRPDLVLWAESDFWPNMLAEIGARKVPLILVQGRVSPKSFAGWRKARGFIARVLADFTLCLGQTPGDSERLALLGAKKTACVGNLKMSVPPLPCEESELDVLRRSVAGRPLWLASSTHPGEEAIAAHVHRALEADVPGLLTIIVPRHPQRGPEVLGEIKALGLSASLRSGGEGPSAQVYVADTMGELGLFYRLAPVVFMGKSLTVEGGQNPFEPALLGAAVLFGPRMSNFPEMAPAMAAAGAARQVADERDLQQAVRELLIDPDRAADMGRKAKAWAEAEAGALDAVMDVLGPYLDGIGRDHAGP
jgi:3-deoxy-D-manno-octulosonic-acid transferase